MSSVPSWRWPCCAMSSPPSVVPAPSGEARLSVALLLPRYLARTIDMIPQPPPLFELPSPLPQQRPPPPASSPAGGLHATTPPPPSQRGRPPPPAAAARRSLAAPSRRR